MALGGGPYGVVDALYFRLLKQLELNEPVAPFRRGHSITYHDDRVLERLGIDTRYVWPGISPSSPATQTEDPDILLDGFGQMWRRAIPYYYAIEGILRNATSVDDIDRIVNWPDVTEPRWMAGVCARAQMLKEETDCFVVGRMVTSHGPFQTAADLRGVENLFVDLALNEDFAMALIERVTDTIDGLLRGYLVAGGEYFDMVELPGDDYAGNQNLLISLSMFRKYFKPALARLVRTIKEYRAEIAVMFHSDGNIAPLIPELIEIGIDVIHPLEPLPSVDLESVKADFGRQIAFLGGIDIVRAMRGTPQDVADEVRTRVQQLAPGGGYVLAPCNHLQDDVPARNVITLFESTRKNGQYPIVA
jgi:uroporphyrinogen decarboxylase